MKKFGVYIHIPFCKQKCNYCDFVSFAKGEEIQNRYVDSLIKEIREFKSKNEFEISTIYIGGGTPSFIDEKNIIKILNELVKSDELKHDGISEKENHFENNSIKNEKEGKQFENYSIKNEEKINQIKEITIEVNPGTVTKEKLETYKSVGINRLSIGLQSANDNILKNIGRIHSFQEFLDTYNLAKNIGFENINVDLMIGLPNQTIEDVKQSLNEVLKLEPKHISVYSLIVEEGTPIFEMVESGKIKLPDEELERNMYWYVKNTLELNGYLHYEISNFAKTGYESKHNLDCWNQKEYIGVGLAAHSYIDRIRFSNITDLEKYMDLCEKGELKKIKIIQEKQTKYTQEQEYMLLGLRKVEGIEIQEFKTKFNENPIFIFKKELNKLAEEELVQVDDDRISLTNKGLDLANLVWEEFV